VRAALNQPPTSFDAGDMANRGIAARRCADSTLTTTSFARIHRAKGNGCRDGGKTGRRKADM